MSARRERLGFPAPSSLFLARPRDRERAWLAARHGGIAISVPGVAQASDCWPRVAAVGHPGFTGRAVDDSDLREAVRRIELGVAFRRTSFCSLPVVQGDVERTGPGMVEARRNPMGIHSYLFVLASTLVVAKAEAGMPPACQPQDGPTICDEKCRANSQESCAVLGIMHLRGEIGGKQDLARAKKLLQSACSANVALGCGGLGSLYGVQKDFQHARPLFEKACSMGDALSCESLGGLEQGAADNKVPADVPAAARRAGRYYRRACELGSGTGCAWVAALIADKVIPGTAKEALDLYLKACNGGMGMACRQAADLLTKDAPEWKEIAATLDAARLANDLLKQACKLGDSKACARTQ